MLHTKPISLPSFRLCYLTALLQLQNLYKLELDKRMVINREQLKDLQNHCQMKESIFLNSHANVVSRVSNTYLPHGQSHRQEVTFSWLSCFFMCLCHQHYQSWFVFALINTDNEMYTRRVDFLYNDDDVNGVRQSLNCGHQSAYCSFCR